jgi:hypothetical protein
MSNCGDHLNFDRLISDKKKYIEIRSELTDSSLPTFSKIVDGIIEKIKESSCGQSFTPNRIPYAGLDGFLIDNEKLSIVDENGTFTVKTQNLVLSNVFTGGVFENGLRTKNLGDLPTGTVVTWKDGKCVESYKKGDQFVMGVVKNGYDEPIILGAEPILVTGHVDEGDYLITSNKPGHCEGVKRRFLFKKDLFGKVIAQSLQTCDGESNLIKAMIRKM